MNAHISENDLKLLDTEPRVHDLRLAEALGFERPRSIRDLIKRNHDELSKYGEVFATVAKTSHSEGGGLPHAGALLPHGAAKSSRERGRPGTEFWLNEPQSVLVCMLSRTDKAAEVRAEIIEVFLAWRRGHAAPGLPPPLGDAPIPQHLLPDDVRNAPLGAKVDFLRLVRSLYGSEVARATYPLLALPALPPAPAYGGRAEALGCLRHLLTWRPNKDDFDLHRMIEAALNDSDVWEHRLRGYGIRVLIEDDAFVIANFNTTLTAIYHPTEWQRSWPRILKRLPGARPSQPMKFADNLASRGTWLPASYLDMEGG